MPPRHIGPAFADGLGPMLSHFNSLPPRARLLTTELLSDPERLTQGLRAKIPLITISDSCGITLLPPARVVPRSLLATTLHATHRNPCKIPQLLFLYRDSTAASTHHSGTFNYHRYHLIGHPFRVRFL
jgi:hypothetical protein